MGPRRVDPVAGGGIDESAAPISPSTLLAGRKPSSVDEGLRVRVRWSAPCLAPSPSGA